MSGGADAEVPPERRVEVRAWQGGQVGDHNLQQNQFIENYIENLNRPRVPVAGPVVAGRVPRLPPAFEPRVDLIAALRLGGPGCISSACGDGNAGASASRRLRQHMHDRALTRAGGSWRGLMPRIRPRS